MAIKGDSRLVTDKLSHPEMRQIARKFVHFNFVVVENNMTLDDYGFNVIDCMPADLTEAEENLELRIPSIMAMYQRVHDMMKYDLEEERVKQSQAEDNVKRKEAEISKDVWSKIIPVEFKLTDKSVASYAISHEDVLRLNMKVAEQKAIVREKTHELEMVKSALDALKAYHKSLEMFIKRVTVGMHYADLPHAYEREEPREITQRTAAKEELLKVEEDPREGFNSWKKSDS